MSRHRGRGRGLQMGAALVHGQQREAARCAVNHAAADVHVSLDMQGAQHGGDRRCKRGGREGFSAWPLTAPQTHATRSCSWTIDALARKFRVRKQRVMAILALKVRRDRG